MFHELAGGLELATALFAEGPQSFLELLDEVFILQACCFGLFGDGVGDVMEIALEMSGLGMHLAGVSDEVREVY